MNSTEQKRHGSFGTRIFFLGVLLTFWQIAILHDREQTQRKEKREDHKRFSLVRSLYFSSFGADAALKALGDLPKKYPGSFRVALLEAAALTRAGHFSAAEQALEKARSIRPALVRDPRFLQQMITVHHQLGTPRNAEKYIRQLTKYQTKPSIGEFP